MEIAPLTSADAAALLPLVEALARHHGDAHGATAATLARDLDDGWLWGFGAGNPLLGYILLMPHAQAQFGRRGADIHHLFVRPEARRRGLARGLIERAEADARRRQCSYLVIGAHRGNDAARATYETAGYTWTEPTFWRFRKML
ncbi:GNAT family N-acetyltransferase [Jannaschia marina]|uniref:GNAT family N-acetyltransferase n=1 Tax=Jannaschia marina TaxID=2741674 RepID=UPI0015CE2DEE|nr:GNAT family N-acetyltransferase [Jannaschia marina]